MYRFYVELNAATYAETPENAARLVLESLKLGNSDCTVTVTDESDSHRLEDHASTFAPTAHSVTRFLTADRCAMIADALDILNPDSAEADDIRQQLQAIFHGYTMAGGAIVHAPTQEEK